MSLIAVGCPRCGKVWTAQQGVPDVECDCHLYCGFGEKPSDCNMAEVNYSGTLKWPVGEHGSDSQEGDDLLHRTYYCSTHRVYSYKEKVIIECDWDGWFRNRVPPELRYTKGEV